jgi:hypothetical protein
MNVDSTVTPFSHTYDNPYFWDLQNNMEFGRLDYNAWLVLIN